MQQFQQRSQPWLLARQACVTGSSCSTFLGMFEPVEPSVVPKAQQTHRRLEDVVKHMQTAEQQEKPDSKTAFKFKWGQLHEPNAYETVLELYPDARIQEQPFLMLFKLPPRLAAQIDIAELPLIGASPDGLICIHPSQEHQYEAVLELKAKVPFSCVKKQWKYIATSTASSKVEAAQFVQVQLEMLVANKKTAYLVYWSCNGTNVFTISVDYMWLQSALAVLCTIRKLYLVKGEVPPTEFYRRYHAQQLHQLTKEAVSVINKAHTVTKADSILNMDPSVVNPFVKAV